jgi:universal stress protein F
MFKAILVPIDTAHESSWRFSIPQALELARQSQAKLTIMTVVREATAMFEGVYLSFQLERMVADAGQKLGAIAGQFKETGIEPDLDVRVGSIGAGILAAATERDVDLIVMASHRPEMRDYLIGPNAAHVAQHARCSVLVLRRFA